MPNTIIPPLASLVRRTVLKELAAVFLLASPVLTYFAATCLAFARNHQQMFMSLVFVAVLASLVILVGGALLSMRPVRRFLALLRDGREDPALTAKAVRCAYRYPGVHGVLGMVCWGGVTNLVLLPPFILLGEITPAEIAAVLVLTILSGVISASLLALIAEGGREAFFEIPEVRRFQAATPPSHRSSLSRKMVRTLFALVSYPTGVLTMLILLENSGTLDLKGSEAGLVLLILVTAAMAVLVSLTLARRITHPVRQASEAAGAIAGGNLCAAVSVVSADELGRLGEGLNAMTARLHQMVATIQGSAEEVSASTTQISRSAQSLSEGTQSQASTLEQTSAAIQQLTASVEQVSGHAQSQAAAVEEGTRSMAQVQESIGRISHSLEEIAGLAGLSVSSSTEGAQAVGQVVDGINLIAGSSEKIAGIVGVISEIADQTNLLALNASIEAARAGEHGRGFAVVAEEVGKLAERSSAATKEIAVLIDESVKNVNQGVQTARGSQLKMEQIRAASQQVNQTIEGLAESTRQQVQAVTGLAGALERVSEMSLGISAATEEQSTNARQVSSAVESVNELTQSAASAAEQMSTSTVQLAGMADQLRKMAARFMLQREVVRA
jgi:methyl-accepting chemotaxis protein